MYQSRPEIIRDRVSTVEFRENALVFFKLDDHVTITLDDAKLHTQYLRERYNGINKFRVLIDPGKYTDLSKEAREFSSLPENNSMTSACAVIVKSMAHRLVMNFIIKFSKAQPVEYQLFENEEKAIDWLKQQG